MDKLAKSMRLAKINDTESELHDEFVKKAVIRVYPESEHPIFDSICAKFHLDLVTKVDKFEKFLLI